MIQTLFCFEGGWGALFFLSSMIKIIEKPRWAINLREGSLNSNLGAKLEGRLCIM